MDYIKRIVHALSSSDEIAAKKNAAENALIQAEMDHIVDKIKAIDQDNYSYQYNYNSMIDFDYV